MVEGYVNKPVDAEPSTANAHPKAVATKITGS